MFTKKFWKAASERAGKSGAQFVLLVVVGGAVAGGVPGETADVINAFALDFKTLAGVFLGGVIVSYLTSIVSAPVGGEGPSLTTSETVK